MPISVPAPRFQRALCCALLAGAATWAQAQVVVRKSADEKTFIDLSGVAISGGESAVLCGATLRSNLERSGWFRIGHPGASAYRVLGSIRESRGQVQADCRVYPAGEQRAVLSRTYREPTDRARALAHRVADDIVEALTGHKGIASTRIVMVGTATGHKELYLCDADGGNLVQLTRDGTISVAPKWGPQAEVLLYTGYLRRFPDVFQIHLETGRRTRLAHYPGLNTGAALSPDRRTLALILSKDGNPELYLKSLPDGRLTRLTRTPHAVEASPSWSPDGRALVYVSDTPGRPHLYLIGRDGGQPRRLTYRGSENVAPHWGPHGIIAYSSRIDGQYKIGLLDPATGQKRHLAPDGADYEDPSWAPNGRHLVCSRTVHFRSQVYILDTVSDTPVRLSTGPGDWYSPAWSPK